jgi:hypothetical protein
MGEWMYRSIFSWLRHKLEVSGKLHAPPALPPRKSPRYSMYRRLGGPRDRSGWLEKWILLLLSRLELRPLGRPVHSQSLYRLRYRSSLIEVVSLHMSQGTEKSHEKTQSEWTVPQTEVRSEHILDTGLERYQLVQSSCIRNDALIFFRYVGICLPKYTSLQLRSPKCWKEKNIISRFPYHW